MEEKKGFNYGYRYKFGVSNMVTETNWGLKNGYGRQFILTGRAQFQDYEHP